jgi:hypothetical protein
MLAAAAAAAGGTPVAHLGDVEVCFYNRFCPAKLWMHICSG